MPLYVADYLADTSHLSTLEHGAYLLLLMHYWRQGKLPSDDRQLAHVARMSLKQWLAIRPTIAGFFDDGWTHSRVAREMDKANQKAEARAAAGAEGGKAKALKLKDAPLAKAKSEPEQTSGKALPSSSLPDIREDESKDPSSRGPVAAPKPAIAKPADLTDAFDRFWLAYPKRGTASNPKQPARISFDKAVKAGADPEAIIAAAGRFDAIERAAARAGTDKVAQAVTWLNQQRWGDYPETVAEPTTLANGSVHIMGGTEEWDAWKAHNGRSKPIDQKGGFWFPSQWPPGWKRETPERKAPASDVFAFDEDGS